MMSKHFFFSVLKEDLRHKTWMIALSLLASFFALPVSWLIMRSNMGRFAPGEVALGQVNDFFEEYLVIGCGVVAIVGALITGLFSFRYVFQKRMVDTWHSLPVKRSTLFSAFYLNGVLIWFVPLLLNMVFTAAMAAGPVCSLGGMTAFGHILKETFMALAILVVIYLLVYHMALVAVMLSGNVLNALVGMGILGIGAICFYGIFILLFTYNMETFYEPEVVKTAIYASPLFSAVYLLYTRVNMGADFWGAWGSRFLLVNLLVAAALGLWAGWLYCRRDSETAEQGVKSRLVGTLFRMAAGILAGICGWQLFLMMVAGSWSAVWAGFGAIFAGVLVFGVLDIVIHMDFKAFFAHKLQMVFTVAAALLVCFSFLGDWFSYDTYLPKKEDVAQIAVFNMSLANRYSYVKMRDEVLESMNYQDVEAIYAYLESAVEREELSEIEYREKYEVPDFEYVDAVATKVTLKNGRSYYRSYHIAQKDREIMWKLFADEEYLKPAYCISEEVIEKCTGIAFSRNGRHGGLENVSAGVISSLAKAYNEDVLEKPECALRGQGRLLVRLELTSQTEEMPILDVYEGMERTVAALKDAGFSEWVAVMDISDISEICLPLGIYVNDTVAAKDLIDNARIRYGIDAKQERAGMEGVEYMEDAPEGLAAEEELTADVTAMVEYYGNDWEPQLQITDPAEIEELMEFVSYIAPFRGRNLFREEYVNIVVENADGERSTCYIPKGVLPEKYILKFGELSK